MVLTTIGRRQKIEECNAIVVNKWFNMNPTRFMKLMDILLSRAIINKHTYIQTNTQGGNKKKIKIVFKNLILKISIESSHFHHMNVIR